MIIVRVTGAREVSKAVGALRIAVPRFQEAVANDLKRGIRFRIRNRIMNRATRIPTASRGKMWRSVKVTRKGNHHVVEMGAPIAPHFWFQEVDKEIAGYRFIPRKGKGRHGQGFMKKARMSSRRRGAHILADAVKSTEARVNQIILRELDKEIRKVGL